MPDLSPRQTRISIQISLILSVVAVLLAGAPLVFPIPHLMISAKSFTMAAEDGSELLLTTMPGAPQALFYDKNKVVRLGAGLTELGLPYVSLYDESGAVISSMDALTKGGEPQMLIRGVGQGAIAWRVTVDEQGNLVITEQP